jgi:Telomeric repeat-binding factor 2.
MLFALSACGFGDSGSNNDFPEFDFSEPEVLEGLSLGSSFAFGNFDFTVSDSVTWAKTDDTYFENNLKDFIKVSLAVKNKSKYYTSISNPRSPNHSIIGPSGNVLDMPNRMAFEDAEQIFKEIVPGGTSEVFVYLPYEGDGEYTIRLSSIGVCDIKFNITKK